MSCGELIVRAEPYPFAVRYRRAGSRDVITENFETMIMRDVRVLYLESYNGAEIVEVVNR